jgi:hypothetical protein
MAIEGQRERERRDETEPRDPVTGREPEERLDPEELGGESEYSVAQAGRHERGSTGRYLHRPDDREPLSQDPDELGRRYLEGAVEAPAQVGGDEYIRLPSDEND